MNRMPFGKYRGRPIDTLPPDYLQWLASLDNLRQPLAGAVRREYIRRAGGSQPPRRSKSLDADLAAQLVTAGYRALALKHHPDHGGDTVTMQRINATVEALRDLVTPEAGR